MTRSSMTCQTKWFVPVLLTYITASLLSNTQARVTLSSSLILKPRTLLNSDNNDQSSQGGADSYGDDLSKESVKSLNEPEKSVEPEDGSENSYDPGNPEESEDESEDFDDSETPEEPEDGSENSYDPGNPEEPEDESEDFDDSETPEAPEDESKNSDESEDTEEPVVDPDGSQDTENPEDPPSTLPGEIDTSTEDEDKRETDDSETDGDKSDDTERGDSGTDGGDSGTDGGDSGTDGGERRRSRDDDEPPEPPSDDAVVPEVTAPATEGQADETNGTHETNEASTDEQVDPGNLATIPEITVDILKTGGKDDKDGGLSNAVKWSIICACIVMGLSLCGSITICICYKRRDTDDKFSDTLPVHTSSMGGVGGAYIQHPSYSGVPNSKSMHTNTMFNETHTDTVIRSQPLSQPLTTPLAANLTSSQNILQQSSLQQTSVALMQSPHVSPHGPQSQDIASKYAPVESGFSSDELSSRLSLANNDQRYAQPLQAPLSNRAANAVKNMRSLSGAQEPSSQTGSRSYRDEHSYSGAQHTSNDHQALYTGHQTPNHHYSNLSHPNQHYGGHLRSHGSRHGRY